MRKAEKPLCLVAAVYYPSYLAHLALIVRRISASRPLHLLTIVINGTNISPHDVENHFDGLARNRIIHQHDNSGLEFGAYQAGLDLLRSSDDNDFDVIILNDTVGVHYPLNTETVSAFVRSLTIEPWPCRAVGIIDTVPRAFSIDQFLTSRWVRSNLIGFDADAISQLGYRIYVPAIDQYVTATADAPSFFSSSVGRSLQDHISRWLFTTSGHRWHSAAPLSPENAAKLAAKARSILQEKYLSMRLEQICAAFLQPALSPEEQRSIRLKSRLARLGLSERVGYVWATVAHAHQKGHPAPVKSKRVAQRRWAMRSPTSDVGSTKRY
jgi:hypothetical protein